MIQTAFRTFLVAGAVFCATSVVQAADVVPAAEPAAAPAPALKPDPFVSELRLGAYTHNLSGRESGTYDLNAELLFSKPWRMDGWADVFIPRPALGATINTAGLTSQVYAGLSWQLPVTSLFFLEAMAGGMVSNNPDDKTDLDYAAMGCKAMFHESATLGMNISDNWTVTATIEHSSNAGFCDENQGLTNAGVRLGYKF